MQHHITIYKLLRRLTSGVNKQESLETLPRGSWPDRVPQFALLHRTCSSTFTAETTSRSNFLAHCHQRRDRERSSRVGSTSPTIVAWSYRAADKSKIWLGHRRVTTSLSDEIINNTKLDGSRFREGDRFTKAQERRAHHIINKTRQTESLRWLHKIWKKKIRLCFGLWPKTKQP